MSSSGPVRAGMITIDRLVRAVWSITAQGLSSASNLALQYGLLVALAAGPFGTAVVALSFYYLSLALGRAWLGDPLAALGPSGNAAPWSRVRWRYLQLGSLAGALVLALAVARPSIRTELIVLAAGLPLLLLQDGYRYRLWSQRRPERVVALDGLWLGVALVIGLGTWALRASGSASWATTLSSASAGLVIVVAWTFGGVASAGLGRLLSTTVDRRVGGPGADGRPGGGVGRRAGDGGIAGVGEGGVGHDGRARSLSVSQTLLALDSNGWPVAVAATAGSAITAGLRAATLPFLPMTSVLGALRVLILPGLRRSVVEGHVASTIAKVVALFVVVSAVMAAIALGVVSVVPPSWLGESGRAVASWYGLAAVIVGARMVNLPMADVLSLGAGPEQVVRTRLVTTGIDWVATIVAAMMWGLPGALVAKTAAAVATTVIWSVTVLMAVASAELPAGEPLTSAVRRPPGFDPLVSGSVGVRSGEVEELDQ